jgi:di/tricarboxylate transporter
MTLRLPQIVVIAAAIVGAIFLVMPVPGGMSPVMMRAAAVIVVALGIWSTGAMPSYFGSLLFLFAAMVLAVAPANVVFSGFHAGATWLVFGGLVIGLAVQRTGLDVRLVRGMLDLFPRSYLALTYGIFAGGTAMTLVVPSASGRVALIVPVVMALAGKLGFGADSKGRTGLVMAATMGTMTPGFSILPSNVPNMGLYGAVESIYGIHLTFAEYTLLNFPVLGIAALIFYPLIIWMLFRESPVHDDAAEPAAAWSATERRLFAILLLALALWVTDRWHGVSPAWVALGAALLMVTPRVGALPIPALARDLDYGPVLFVAGIIGLGAVVTETGLGALVADHVLRVAPLSPGHDALNYAIVVAVGMVVGLLTTLPAQPSVIVPLAQHMADASGWPLMSVLLAPVASWSAFPFYYQAPPVVLAVALANLRIGRVTALLCAYMVFALLFVLPLHYLWGRALGYFGA